jgi:predicted esterase
LVARVSMEIDVMISSPMNMKKTGLLALVALGIFQISVSQAMTDAPRTGDFTIALTPEDLLGEAAEKVASILAADELISWEVRVPENYSAESPPGIVVYVSPLRSGALPPEWTRVMDESNLIWISANKAGNRVIVSERTLKAVLALNAIQQEYVLDDSRIYVAGLSGGGKMASMIAIHYADTFDGGLFICGVKSWTVDEPEHFEAIKSNRYVFLTGEHDQALATTKSVYHRYKDAGVPQIQLVVVKGMGHANPEQREFRQAIEFLDNGSSE